MARSVMGLSGDDLLEKRLWNDATVWHSVFDRALYLIKRIECPATVRGNDNASQGAPDDRHTLVASHESEADPPCLIHGSGATVRLSLLECHRFRRGWRPIPRHPQRKIQAVQGYVRAKVSDESFGNVDQTRVQHGFR